MLNQGSGSLLTLIDIFGILMGSVLSGYVYRLTRNIHGLGRIVSNSTITGVLLMTVAFASSIFGSHYEVGHTDEIYHVLLIVGMFMFVLASKHLARIVKNLQDTNELLKNKTAELELAIAKDLAIINSMGDGVFVTDEKSRFILLNKRAEELFGKRKAELIGKDARSIPLFYDGKPLTGEMRPLSEVFRTKKPFFTMTPESRFSLGRPDGSVIPIAFNESPILLNGIVGAVVVFRDITEEKRIDTAKSEFVSLASHQLQTPLTTVGWYAEILLSEDAGPLAPDQKKYLQQIYNSNRRMIELVKALLNVSRIELGTLMIEPRPTDLLRVAKETLQDLQPQIKKRSLHLKTVVDPSKIELNVDPQLIRIVIQNLLTNAMKYTPAKGHISLHINRRTDDVLIAVQDDGYGIPIAEKSKIFTRLFRGSNVVDKETEGTGLGLYIAKAIVERSGGKIWFESEEQKGSTFYVSLPLTGMREQAGSKTLLIQ